MLERPHSSTTDLPAIGRENTSCAFPYFSTSLPKIPEYLLSAG
jgi:hypothetical protein